MDNPQPSPKSSDMDAVQRLNGSGWEIRKGLLLKIESTPTWKSACPIQKDKN